MVRILLRSVNGHEIVVLQHEGDLFPRAYAYSIRLLLGAVPASAFSFKQQEEPYMEQTMVWHVWDDRCSIHL